MAESTGTGQDAGGHDLDGIHGLHGPERQAIGTVPVAMAVALRKRGVEVPVDATVAFGRALGAVGLARRSWVYWSGRATLVTKLEDIPVYDQVFASLWSGPPGPPTPAEGGDPADPTTVPIGDQPDGGDLGDGDASERQEVSLAASATELLSHKDFASCTPDELEEAQHLMRSLRMEGARRHTHRWRRSRRAHGRADLHRTISAAVRSGGEILAPRHLESVTKPRRLVLLFDVSGSMDIYARALLRLLHVVVAGRNDVEAFALGTRLTRLTRHLTSHDPDTAMAAATSAVPDWSGGTRLGESLQTFNDRFGVRGMARGSVVVILSDGWDTGDPEMLGAEMSRLRRVAYRVVWVNPMKATAGYQPLARGMAAALPYVDSFLEGHSVASLGELSEIIGREGVRA